MENKVITKKKEDVKTVSNAVVLTGTIVNKYEKPNVTIVTLGITEPGRFLKTEKKYLEESNYPKIYFFKNDNTGIEKFSLYDKITVNAHISAPVKRRPDGSTFTSQGIIGENCVKAEDEMGVAHPQNVVKLQGKIRRITRMKSNVINIEMEAVNKHFMNIVTVTSFNKTDLIFAPDDVVSVTGKVVTSTKERKEKVAGSTEPVVKKVHYQNIVASKIIKVK